LLVFGCTRKLYSVYCSEMYLFHWFLKDPRFEYSYCIILLFSLFSGNNESCLGCHHILTDILSYSARCSHLSMGFCCFNWLIFDIQETSVYLPLACMILVFLFAYFLTIASYHIFSFISRQHVFPDLYLSLRVICFSQWISGVFLLFHSNWVLHLYFYILNTSHNWELSISFMG
jgi:hypothetical protein